MFSSLSPSHSRSRSVCVVFAPLLWLMSPFLSGIIFSCFSNTVFNDFPFILLVTNTHAIFHCEHFASWPKEERPTSILPKLILMPEPWSHAKMREEAFGQLLLLLLLLNGRKEMRTRTKNCTCNYSFPQ